MRVTWSSVVRLRNAEIEDDLIEKFLRVKVSNENIETWSNSQRLGHFKKFLRTYFSIVLVSFKYQHMLITIVLLYVKDQIIGVKSVYCSAVIQFQKNCEKSHLQNIVSGSIVPNCCYKLRIRREHLRQSRKTSVWYDISRLALILCGTSSAVLLLGRIWTDWLSAYLLRRKWIVLQFYAVMWKYVVADFFGSLSSILSLVTLGKLSVSWEKKIQRFVESLNNIATRVFT